MKKVILIISTGVVALILVAGVWTLTNERSHPQTETYSSSSTSSSSYSSSSSSESSSSKSDSSSADSQSSSASAPSTNSTQPSASQPTNGTAVVNNANDAIQVIQKALGNNSDLGYEVLSDNNGTYQIKVVSKSIQAQGGSGTVDIYTVMPDGSYQAKY